MDFQELFIESGGKPILHNGKKIIMVDRINLPSKKILIKVKFIETNSKWKQGIIFQTKGDFAINNQVIKNKAIFWEHTAPKEFDVVVNSKDTMLVIYNAWQTEDGTIHYWYNGGAMHKSETENIYHCNDGQPDDDFDDLVFKIEYI